MSLLVLVPQVTLAAPSQPNYSRNCSCVNYAKWYSGINVGKIGYARNHPINTHTPRKGAIVVLNEGKVGHVAAVVAVNKKKQTIEIREANYRHCQVTTRTLSIRYKKIRGYYVAKR